MEDMIKKYTQFIYEQQSVAPMTNLDPKNIAESWDSDDLITEALNDLGESEETEGLAEACELLDLLDEATTSALHRQALMSDAAKHTALTNLFSGRPARGIVNKFMRDFGPLNPEAPAFPLATSAVAPLRAAADGKGQSDYSPLWSGQNASDCQALPAADIAHKLLQGWT